MSLIQQALKRKMDEEQGRATPPPPPLASTPLAGTPPAVTPKRSIEVLPAMQPPPRTPAPEPAESHAHRKLAFAHAPETPAHTGGESHPASPLPADIDTEPVAAIPIPPPPPEQHPPPAQRSAIHRETPVGFSTGTKAFILLIVLLLIGGAVFLVLWGTKSPLLASYFLKTEGPQDAAATSVDGAASPAAKPPAAPDGAKKGGLAAAVPLPDVPAIQARVEKMKTAVEASRKDLAAASGDSAAASGAVSPPVQIQSQAAVTPAPKPAVVVQPVAKAPPQAAVVTPPRVDWPAIRIGGVMPHVGGGQQTAIINDSLVGVGEGVDGLTLIEVKDKGVVLEYKGATRYFPIGATRR